MAEPKCTCETLLALETGVEPKCFGQTWIFEGAPAEVWGEISFRLLRRNLGEGEELFRQGSPADSMYMIKAGSVKLSKITDDGRMLTLDIRKAGDLLGENVLVEESGEYPVSATSLEPTLVCGIDRKTFENLVTDFPQAGLAVIRNLSKRIGSLSGKLGAMAEHTLEDRLYQVLVNVAREVGSPERGGWTISFPLTHEEIGFLVGAHRVSVTRAIGKLRESGQITMKGRLLFVSDLQVHA